MAAGDDTQPGSVTLRGLARQRQRVRRYWRTGGWLVGDIVRRLALRIAALLALNVAAMAARIATFGGFIAFVHLQSADTVAGGAWFQYLPPASNLAAWCLLILGAGIAMGLLGYFEARYRLVLGADYSTSAMRRALDIVSAHGAELEYLWQRSPRYISRLVSSDSALLMRAVMPVVGSVRPLVQLLSAAAILVLMSWQLALLIALFALAYLVPYMYLSQRVIRIAREREQNPVLAALSHMIDHLVRCLRYPQFGGGIAHDNIARVLSSEALKERLRLTIDLRTNKSVVQLLNSVFIALFIVAFLLGMDRFGPGAGAAALLAFALALVHAYQAANQLTSQLAGFNRFYPPCDRIVELLRHPEWKERPAPRGTSPRPVVLTVRRADERLPGSAPRLELRPRGQYLVLQPGRPGIHNLQRWIANLRARNTLGGGAVMVLPPERDFPEATVGELLRGGAVSADALAPLLALPWLKLWLESLPRGLDTPWSEAAGGADAAIRAAVAAAPALPSGQRHLLLHVDAWERIEPSRRADLVACFADACWLIGSTRPGQVPDLAFDQVVVATRAGIIGIGDRAWLDQALAGQRNLFVAEPEQDERALAVDEEEPL